MHIQEPEAWMQNLPAPWKSRAIFREPDALETSDGRLLLRHLPCELPPYSGREILSARSLDGVPSAAREVLEAYWRKQGEG